ncbi:uncharacterized protein M6B38_134860 [Iris pallida]|uniref:Leucine-rich repeat-containing N-terminal plant-type domain-containing protein n=1 Tax=Iris pallida TaxID=29817 RepID=A0AAX6FFD2_IRIPA|nr:uncharacterized protein M6B38_134860 [Iris pallida]
MEFRLALLSMVLLSSCRPSSSILDPGDFLALQSIRKSLSDLPGSSFFQGWDFTADPCAFPGVFCSSDRVVALSLGDPRAGSPGLTGRLPPALGQLSALSDLTLVPGRVFGPLPDSLSSCSQLLFLALASNFLSGPLPDSLSSLAHLRTLDLSFNLLSGTIPPPLASLPSLSNLVLCHNRLSGAVPRFPDSSALVRLDLKHNNLSGEVPSLPPTLRYLSLSSNALTGRVDRVLPRLTRLSYLDLSTNRLAGPVPACVFGLPLDSLQLQRNALEGPVAPEGEVTIPVVDLSYNRLSGFVSPLLASVGSLYLNNNRFTGAVPARFGERLVGAGMQVLYLQHNFLTGMEISPAADIPASSSLCLQYNCMVPPLDTPCPLKAGTAKTRPSAQCPEWRA